MATENPFAGIVNDEPHSSQSLREFYLSRAKRGFGSVRHVFVQKQQGDHARTSTLARFVNQRQHAALDLYLLLLALEPVVVESPISLQAWTLLLGPQASAATTAKAFKTLQEWKLVHREPGKALYRVRPLREDAEDEPYTRPDGSKDFIQWYFSIPSEYWTDGHCDRLTLPGKAMMLVLLAGTSQKPSQNVPAQQVKDWYGFSERTAERGYRELNLAKLIREHEAYERDPRSPINLRRVYHRAFNEPFDTATRHKRQDKAAKAMRKKNPRGLGDIAKPENPRQ
jgi:hypothetical protein